MLIWLRQYTFRFVAVIVTSNLCTNYIAVKFVKTDKVTLETRNSNTVEQETFSFIPNITLSARTTHLVISVFYSAQNYA